MTAIFKDVGQALHFAFMVEQYPNGSKSSLVRVAREAMGERRNPEIDFGGLSQTEVHAQCANIRHSVWESLTSTEAAAMVAKYSHNTAARERAMLIVGAHIRQHLDEKLSDHVLADHLLRRHYLEESAMSVRQIGLLHGVSKDKIHRLAVLLARQADRLEAQAMDNLRRQMQAKHIIRGGAHG